MTRLHQTFLPHLILPLIKFSLYSKFHIESWRIFARPDRKSFPLQRSFAERALAKAEIPSGFPQFFRSTQLRRVSLEKSKNFFVRRKFYFAFDYVPGLLLSCFFRLFSRNSTESLPVPEKSGRNVRGDEMGRSKTFGWRTTGSDAAAVKNSPKTTSASVGTMKKAEAVTAKDSLSMEKEYNSHLGFFILSSIGLVVMATLTFTSVYFSRTRRDQSCQRQNQDIEVCSISSIGNELW